MRPLRDDVDDEGIYDSLFEFQWVSAHFQPSIGTEEGELVRPPKNYDLYNSKSVSLLKNVTRIT